MDAEPYSSSDDQPSTSPLMKLPSETFGSILSYLRREDLVKLSLVSKSFRELAASQLYRSISHVFHSDVGCDNDISVDHLAGVLETLTTSDFNYAAYIKEISLDSRPDGDGSDSQLQEQIAQQFKYDRSCGKFFNNLLLATIKKIAALETLRWNIRVEINSSVFAALGKITSLQHVHVRLQAGPSLHSVIPPLATSPDPAPAPSQHHQYNNLHHHGHPPYSSVLSLPQSTPAKPGRQLDVHGSLDKLRTFSHFSHLTSLEILDMDTQEYVSEIAKCISQSSRTLKTLKLSFSEHLALKARKKEDPDATEASSAQDEEELYDNDGLPLPPPPPAQPGSLAFTSSIANDANIRRERISQEKTLERIFGLEKGVVPPKNLEEVIEDAIVAANDESQTAAKTTPKEDADRLFIEKLQLTVKDLTRDKATHPNNAKGWKVIETLEKAAAKYLESREEADNAQETHEDGANAAAPQALDDEPDNSDAGTSAMDIDSSETSLQESVPSASHQSPVEDRLAEVIDMEHPDEISEGEDQEFMNQADVTNGDKAQRPKRFVQLEENPTKGSLAELELEPRTRKKGKDPIISAEEIDDSTPKDLAENTKPEHGHNPGKQDIDEYVREHHGLPLENLSINLIPIKSPVICQAVNIWALKHVSLLNVGPQKSFWEMLSNLQETNPLQIISIHTDNVTPAFLECVNKLGRLEELFMIERSSHSRVEPFAAKTTVCVEDIRIQVLEKHAEHLKRLMIRNDNDTSWSLCRASVVLLTRFGTNLTELVVPLDSMSFHQLMNGISRLESLTVFHVLFSHIDYCPGVLNEIRACAIDNILHFDSLKVEHVAVSYAANGPVGTRVAQLQRVKGNSAASAFKKRKLDQIKECMDQLSITNPDSPLLATVSESMSSWEQSFDITGKVGFVTTSEKVNFQDEPGIRVWQKEIWNLRL